MFLTHVLKTAEYETTVLCTIHTTPSVLRCEHGIEMLSFEWTALPWSDHQTYILLTALWKGPSWSDSVAFGTTPQISPPSRMPFRCTNAIWNCRFFYLVLRSSIYNRSISQCIKYQIFSGWLQFIPLTMNSLNLRFTFLSKVLTKEERKQLIKELTIFMPGLLGN